MIEPRLALYIAKPLRPVGLIAAGVAAGTGAVLAAQWADRQIPPAQAFAALGLLACAAVLGASISFVVAPDVDGAERLLHAVPRRFVWTLASRAAGWLVIVAGTVLVAAGAASDPLAVSTGSAFRVAVGPALLAAAGGLVGGRLRGSLVGAGCGLGLAAMHLAASMLRPQWQFALPLDPTRPGFENGTTTCIVAAAIVFAAAASIVPLTLNDRAEEKLGEG